MRSFKTKYLAAIARGETVSKISSKKTGRPLTLGEIDGDIQNYVKLMREIEVILPYVQRIKKERNLPADQRTLVTFDVFKVHRVEDVETVLGENNVVSVIVPSNCTDRLQPLDLTAEYRYSSWKKTASEEQWNLFCHLHCSYTTQGHKHQFTSASSGAAS